MVLIYLGVCLWNLLIFLNDLGKKFYLIICYLYLIKIKFIIFMGIMVLVKWFYFVVLLVLIVIWEWLKK